MDSRVSRLGWAGQLQLLQIFRGAKYPQQHLPPPHCYTALSACRGCWALPPAAPGSPTASPSPAFGFQACSARRSLPCDPAEDAFAPLHHSQSPQLRWHPSFETHPSRRRLSPAFRLCAQHSSPASGRDPSRRTPRPRPGSHRSVCRPEGLAGLQAGARSDCKSSANALMQPEQSVTHTKSRLQILYILIVGCNCSWCWKKDVRVCRNHSHIFSVPPFY